jgi:hypothetical protein
MKIFPLTIYVLLKPFIQILPSDSKKSLWDSRTTATLIFTCFTKIMLSLMTLFRYVTHVYPVVLQVTWAFFSTCKTANVAIADRQTFSDSIDKKVREI